MDNNMNFNYQNDTYVSYNDDSKYYEVTKKKSGTASLVFSILAVLFGVLSPVVAITLCFCCCGGGLTGLILAILGIICVVISTSTSVNGKMPVLSIIGLVFSIIGALVSGVILLIWVLYFLYVIVVYIIGIVYTVLINTALYY